jgi:hypothetical protein
MIFHFGFSLGIRPVQITQSVQAELSSVTITGGMLSVSISGLPQISEPQVTGGTLQATISSLPTISDIKVQ